MKTLQNNFTTPEQSKRLLELGLPADSADCYLMRSLNTVTFYPHILFGETYTQKDKFLNVLDYLPCWSVGRLIEIFDICASEYMNGIKIPRNHIILDKVLIEFLGVLQRGDMDFSKLDE